MFYKFSAGLILILACSSCTSAGQNTQPHQSKNGKTLTATKDDGSKEMATQIAGTITHEGVLCRTMRGKDGELYTFSYLPEAIETGDEVVVERDMSNMEMVSVCDQGLILHWASITRPATTIREEKTWLFDARP